MDSTSPKGLLAGADGQLRCWWHGGYADYQHYHDHEWGFPVYDDYRLFEKICLEGFQSGLSWLTILRKRENFRQAFAGFDFEEVARFDEQDVQRLLKNAGIVRHQGKIRSTINNARKACELVESEGSLSNFFWKFVPPPDERPNTFTYEELGKLSQTPTSKALSKKLKKQGWSFVGPTTAYAFMQAMGLVNDHLDGCVIRQRVEQ